MNEERHEMLVKGMSHLWS